MDAITIGFAFLGVLQTAIIALLVRTNARMDKLVEVVSDLRVEVGKIGQRLDDHIGDDRAHIS